MRGRPPKEQARDNPRRRRRALDGDRYKLQTPPIKGYRTRLINDVGNRIYEKTELDDWDFVYKNEIPDPERPGQAMVGDPSVTSDQGLGAKVSKIVGYGERGPIHAYLCKKKLEFWNEDIEQKRQKNAEILDELQRNPNVENREGAVDIKR